VEDIQMAHWLKIAALLLLLPAASNADELSDAAGRYKVLSSSHIHFSVAQMGGAAVEGEFRTFDGQFQLDGNDIGHSKVSFVIKPGSVTAVDPRVEAFIRSAAVFDTARFPEVRFVSTRISRTGTKNARIEGKLSAKGVTRNASFDVVLEGRSKGTLKFHVTGKMSRALFNMDVGTPIYSNMVVLDMHLSGKSI
jgi:polyisoprenoid-binding protein YceI